MNSNLKELVILHSNDIHGTFAGEKDLCRGIADIPLFRLFEYNFE